LFFFVFNAKNRGGQAAPATVAAIVDILILLGTEPSSPVSEREVTRKPSIGHPSGKGTPVKTVAIVMIGLTLPILVACQTTAPPNRGHTGNRMDPSRDAASEVYTGTLRSADLITATDRMAQDIASRLDVTDRDSPPRIVVGRIENRTSMPHQNYQVFLTRLRAQLMSSGSRSGLEFIRDRRFIEQQQEREYGAGASDGYRSRADYVLTCEMWDMPSGDTRYYLLDYQLVQLRDAETGPNLGAGAIVWENKYEVKFR